MSLSLLLVGHLPSDPPEATLVLAAAGACNGLLRDGKRSGGIPHAPSLRQLAQILGIHVDAVRRGVRHLQAAGEARMHDGVIVEPEALRRRWEDERQLAGRAAPAKWFQVRITAELLQLELPPRALLLAGLVAGLFNDRHRELRLSVPFLAERLGIPLRTVERLAVQCEKAGALHSWTRPAAKGGCRKLKVWRPGPRLADAVEKPSSDGGRGGCQMAVGPSSDGGPPIVKWRSAPSPDGGHLPGSFPEVLPEVQPGTRVRGAEDASPPEAEPDPEKALVAAILRSPLRSNLPPLARLKFAVTLAKPLTRAGMRADEFDALSAKASRHGPEAHGGVLAKMLAGHWRAELDAGDEAQRHAAAMARRAGNRRAEQRDGPYGGAAPNAAGDVAGDLIQRLRNANA